MGIRASWGLGIAVGACALGAVAAACASQEARSHAARGFLAGSQIATAGPSYQGELPRPPTRWSRELLAEAPRGGGPQAPDAFAREVGRRLREIDAQVRADVANQSLQPEALDEVAARRPLVLRLVREGGADGMITPRERAQVAAVMREMAERAYQMVAMPYAWPGGGRYWR